MGQQALQQSGQDPRLGVVLQERYRIVRLLGVGGMGSVYEGEHILIKRRVAIKVLHQKYADSQEIVARFQREAEAATSIGHPNIVEVTDMGKFPDGTAYMVLEFLEGRDLRHDLKREGAQPIAKLVHIVRQVCDALFASHRKGIVHRDLKPDNIYLIERRGDTEFAKVLDFGISKMADSSEEDRSLTQTGTALGTPFYMAPEQCQGRKDIDGRADIYSLGVIMFRALTGAYPFDDESYPMLVLKICTEPTPSIRRYRPDVPPELEAVIHRMLAKDRNHRYPDCTALSAALAPFAAWNAPIVVAEGVTQPNSQPSVLANARSSVPTVDAVPQPAPVPAEPSSSSRALLWAGLVGALLFLGLVAGTVVFFVALRLDPLPPEPVTIESPADDDEPTPGSDTEAPPPEDPAPAIVAPPVVPPVAEAPPVAADVHVTIRATPADARIEIDGVPYPSNPFEADLPRGDHLVRVTAEGYTPYEATVPFVLNNYRHPVDLARIGGVRSNHPPAVAPRPATPTVFNPPPTVRQTPRGVGGFPVRPPPATTRRGPLTPFPD